MSNELAKRWHGVGQGSRPRTAGSFSPVARVLDSLGHTSNSQLASHLGLKQPGGQGWRSLASCQSTVAEACIIAASPAEGSTEPKPPKPLGEVLSDAGRKALGGGVPGMVAMATQVFALMWMRTTINYQYRYGTDTTTALRTLYKEGGVRRFYRGLLPALVQGPMSRFGDTAANAGTLALLDSYESTRSLPVGVKTLASSAAAGTFRIFLMPVDTVKTIMQVEGKDALRALYGKVRTNGPGVMYHGALAASAATFVGHYPWFATYNYLNALLPAAPADDLPRKLGRSAVLGFCSSFVSDCCSNSIRVIKTTKQTTTEAMTYPQVAKMIIAKDGVLGLMGRGLKTKIIANGMQGICFTIVWRMGQDWWEKHHDAAPSSAAQQHQQTDNSAPAAAARGGSGGGNQGKGQGTARLAVQAKAGGGASGGSSGGGGGGSLVAAATPAER